MLYTCKVFFRVVFFTVFLMRVQRVAVGMLVKVHTGCLSEVGHVSMGSDLMHHEFFEMSVWIPR